jgi:hypothetical protein
MGLPFPKRVSSLKTSCQPSLLETAVLVPAPPLAIDLACSDRVVQCVGGSEIVRTSAIVQWLVFLLVEQATRVQFSVVEFFLIL